jgi:hypothetical protein
LRGVHLLHLEDVAHRLLVVGPVRVARRRDEVRRRLAKETVMVPSDAPEVMLCQEATSQGYHKDKVKEPTPEQAGG